MDLKLQIKYSNTADVVSLKEGDEQNQSLSPYAMIKYSIRSELTRKYYERRLRKFFDFIQFGIGFMLLRLVTQYKNTMNYPKCNFCR